MKIENQVCTLEQARRLKELGIDQRSEYAHILVPVKGFVLEHIAEFNRWAFQYNEPLSVDREKYSAFTVAELGVMIDIKNKRDSVFNPELYKIYHLLDNYTGKESEAFVRASLLISALLSGVITPEECNKRLQEA